MTERFHPVWQGLIAAASLTLLGGIFAPAVSRAGPKIASIFGVILGAGYIFIIVRVLNETARRRPKATPDPDPDTKPGPD